MGMGPGGGLLFHAGWMLFKIYFEGLDRNLRAYNGEDMGDYFIGGDTTVFLEDFASDGDIRWEFVSVLMGWCFISKLC